MDLRQYYQKIRMTSASIADPFPVVVSRDTGDGGKAGTFTEVPKALAAKMVVDGSARLATAEEAGAFHQRQAELKRMAEQATAATMVQVAVLSRDELSALRELSQPSKG